jgi:hypothetical protein
VARHWATGGRATVDMSALDGLKAAGAPPQVLEAKHAELLQTKQDQSIELWPEHQRVYDVFCAMRWCMVGAGMGRPLYVCLKYEMLELVERRIPAPPDLDPAHNPDPATLFAQLQDMERVALQHLNTD